VNVATTVPTGASVTCSITDGTHSWTDTIVSDGTEMTFTDTIANPHLWNGKQDPHLYTITLEISKDGSLYHRFQRDYGLRYYSYIINDSTVIQGQTYTGFLLNGSPYYLRGVCMHDDVDGKANALNAADYTQEFAIIQELGCNFIRLAHYPHPKEVYDWCDQLGIIVQTEVPCVNKLQSTMPSDYYTHLTTQYTDMVNQHYNHPCIMFWGLSNETTTDDKAFAKTKIEEYTNLIRSLDSERMVGYVMSHSYNNPSSYYNNPDVDWFGCNIYTGWYIDKTSNNPTSQLNTRVSNIITSLQKPLAFSEYGAGGTQHCHSDDPQTTTTKGNYERHDIEYQMWLHEGHIAAIRNFPQLLFTAQWQLFDIAVSNRNEGYTVCLDGETTSTDDNLRRLNNKGLVERDHITKKDTFYLYKAEWNSTPFVHICGKDYTKTTDRVIKCYTNDGNSVSLYVNNTLIETVSVTNHIATFTARTFSSGDVVRVNGSLTNDTFTF
jgi:beta-galactosidase